jgi:ABC-2 type transport system permease protein
MRNVWTVTKREFSAYFASPVAYVVGFGVLLIIGIFFYIDLAAASNQFGGGSTPEVSRTTGLLAFLLLFVVPAITMRLMAEEQRTGTIELLFTAPVNEWEVVLGKWLGAFALMALLTLLTGIHAVILNNLVAPELDRGLIVADYFGLLLLIGATLAVGVCLSSLFSNQIAAFFAIFATLIVAWIIEAPFQNSVGGLADFFKYLSLTRHYYNNFPNGVVDVGDVVFFVSVTALFLFAAAQIVQSRRWR